MSPSPPFQGCIALPISQFLALISYGLQAVYKGFPKGRFNNVFNRHFKPLMQTARLADKDGLPIFRFHDLRHFAISSWIAEDFGPKAVQTFAGHASIQTTFDVYGHLFPDREGYGAAMGAIEDGLA